MKKTMKFLPLVIIMALCSCSSEPIIESETTLQSVASKANIPVVVVDNNGDEINGATSSIHRNKNGITVNFKTNELIPGNAYTMWFVVFGDEPGPPSSTHAAGHIVGGSGKGNFSGHLSVGDLFDHPNIMTIFNNPLTAEVHVVIRTHGPAQPGMMPGQIQTIDGGCTSGFPSGPTLHADSDIVGYCANIQVAIHPAVN